MEEPTSPDDVLGHAAIARAIAPIKVATGEHCHEPRAVQAAHAGRARSASARSTPAGSAASTRCSRCSCSPPTSACPCARTPAASGLCELTQHLSIVDYICVGASLDGRLLEYVDHLHEHFADPVRMRGGRYLAPERPGYSAQIKAESLDEFGVPGRRRVEVVIVTPMTPEDAERIAAEDGVELTYLPELLPARRWVGDINGEGGVPLDDPRWQDALERAEVVFGIPGSTGEGLVGLAAARRGSSGSRPATPAPASSSAPRWRSPTPASSTAHGDHLLRRPRRAARRVRDPRPARVRQGPAGPPARPARAPLAGGPDAGRRAARPDAAARRRRRDRHRDRAAGERVRHARHRRQAQPRGRRPPRRRARTP